MARTVRLGQLAQRLHHVEHPLLAGRDEEDVHAAAAGISLLELGALEKPPVAHVLLEESAVLLGGAIHFEKEVPVLFGLAEGEAGVGGDPNGSVRVARDGRSKPDLLALGPAHELDARSLAQSEF
jgi:hypothetical protein